MTLPGTLPNCVPAVSWTPDPLLLSTALWTPQTGPLPPGHQWRTEACCSVQSPEGPGQRQAGAGREHLGSGPRGPHHLQTHAAEPWGFCSWRAHCWRSRSTGGCHWRRGRTVWRRCCLCLETQRTKSMRRSKEILNSLNLMRNACECLCTR